MIQTTSLEQTFVVEIEIESTGSEEGYQLEDK
jgi:hypothetical protein